MRPNTVLMTISSYFTWRFLAILLAAGIATAHVTLWLTGTAIAHPLEIIFGLLLVLVLPGYVLIEAMIPTREFGLAEQVALGAGLSIAITTLSSIVLNLTPWGLQRGSWTVLLDGIVILSSCVALARHGTAATAPIDASVRRWPFSFAGSAALGFALLLTVAALGGAARGEERISSRQPLEMWVIPSGVAHPALHIGVRDFQSSPQTFGIIAWRGCSLVRRWGPFTLKGTRTWHGTLPVKTTRSLAQPVRLFLYHPTTPWAPIRRLTWWPSNGSLTTGCTTVTTSLQTPPMPRATPGVAAEA